MLKIISNTTPILSLLKIDKLEILKHLYGEIIIPNAVFQEIEQGINKPYYRNLKDIHWISIQEIKDKKTLQYFNDLDAGEAEVLILANEINANLVIIDEILGRRFAKKLSIPLTGTLGIILKAKELNYIDSVNDLVIELRNKGTWINPKLVNTVLRLANEEIK
jgi:predicted nucleic acid-binding protein